jgi:hypothetical protein
MGGDSAATQVENALLSSAFADRVRALKMRKSVHAHSAGHPWPPGDPSHRPPLRHKHRTRGRPASGLTNLPLKRQKRIADVIAERACPAANVDSGERPDPPAVGRGLSKSPPNRPETRTFTGSAYPIYSVAEAPTVRGPAE